MATGQAPVYRWDDGGDRVYTRGERIDPDQPTVLLQPGPRSLQPKIAPFQRVYGTQAFDRKYRYLVSPRLAEGKALLSAGNDWSPMARNGMDMLRLPFSGEHGFTGTVSYHRLSHGVAAADQAPDCMDCHGSTGRIAWKELGHAHDPWAAVQPVLHQPGSHPSREKPPEPVIEEVIAKPPSQSPAEPAQ